MKRINSEETLQNIGLAMLVWNSNIIIFDWFDVPLPSEAIPLNIDRDHDELRSFYVTSRFTFQYTHSVQPILMCHSRCNNLDKKTRAKTSYKI